MAIVRRFDKIEFDVPGKHTEVNATYAIIGDKNGEKFLQIDTYGSSSRQIKGKKSQSIRLSQEALDQLFKIYKANF
ncbi:MAG: methionyl-tRNA formyltransferase [Deltaproteobacteria bacterium]|nr:methionyl-tRNA formyltransferase [Deltaproteobacteria bacterium]TLN02729.1 MAG: methionyl-tRNA formyltransferase [bacterium]